LNATSPDAHDTRNEPPTLDPGAQGRLIEIFFGIITRQAIRRGTFISVADLVGAIRTFIDGYNTPC
jgi:hypothetical protein